MAFTDFTKDVARQISYTGSVFVSDDDGVTWYDLGIVRDVNMKGTANNTSKNTAGRIKQLSTDIDGQIIMMQTSDDEFDNLNLLTDPTGDGLWLKFTDECATAATAGAAAGKVFENVNFTAEPEINWDGQENMIMLKFTGRVSNSELTNFGTTGTLTFC